ncbi:MAG: DUF3795 domain-containing protein [Chloroflexota bacterium]|nr:DUF3795 domain-containing protein [Chloroflexota bacterium]
MQASGKEKIIETVLSLCGMRCDLCLAYRPNIEIHPENRQILSDGWHTYFGFRISPEDIECDGCFPDGKPTIDSECKVKPCVTARGLENCAGCRDYICKKLASILATFESIQLNFDHPIPDADRQRLVFPYENADRLAALHQKK